MGLGTFASGYYDVETQLPSYLLRRSMEQIRRTNEEKSGIDSIDQFEERRTRLLRYFEEMIGGLPLVKSPLHANCTGELEREGYKIRKIVFQSLPGVYVTANLYLPLGTAGPLPAVLFACGHIEAGKAAPIYQKVCIDLVRSGMAVLAVDPISQGERMQGYVPELGRTLVRWHAEHTYLGLQCELAGSHILRYFVWDLIRAVDYLCELEEIDASRIGITGNSGGGIQTLMAMIMDERIAAAAPCTYITSREAYMKTGQPQDGEQILDGAIAAGMDYDDYITLFAPKPVLIGAVESDFFCLEGTLDSLTQAKKVYRLYGKEENIELALAKGTHSYNDELRGLVVPWFAEQFFGKRGNGITEKFAVTKDAETLTRLNKDEQMKLSGVDSLRAERQGLPPVPERTSALQCTESGQVLGEFEDAVSVQAVNARRLPQLKGDMARRSKDTELWKTEIRQWLNMPACASRIYPRSIHSSRADRSGNNRDEAYLKEDIFFFSEPDITVGGTWVRREGMETECVTLLVLDEGASAIHMEHEWLELLTEGSQVLAFDPRGTGDFRSRAVNGRGFDVMFGTEYKLGCDARMLGAPLAGMRVFDLLRAIDYIKQEQPAAKIRMAGKGFAAIYALLAGVIDERVELIELIDLPVSFADTVETRFYKYDVRLHMHGALRCFDLPELIQAFKQEKKISSVTLPDMGAVIRF